MSTQSIAGATARQAFEPTSLGTCIEVFQGAATEKLALACVGGGTELALGGRPHRLDAIVRTGRLDRVIEYNPSDQVVDVEGGITLGALQRVLAVQGQRLAIDPPHADQATIGGLLATNAFGPLRTRFGSLRDLIIGVTLLRADGVPARGGGKVVKTVAGFDLPKVVIGSLGTLGMILSATFRVHPAPESTRTVRVARLTPGQVRALVVGIRERQLEAVAFAAVCNGARFDLGILFEGFQTSVARQHEGLNEVLTAARLTGDTLSADEATGFWSTHDAARCQGDVRIKISALPSVLEQSWGAVADRISEALHKPSAVWYPSLGLAFFTGGGRDAPALSAAIAAARAAIGHVAEGPVPAAHAAWITVESVPDEWRAAIDVWGPTPPGFSIMRRLKARLDPEARMNPGRFVGGL